MPDAAALPGPSDLACARIAAGEFPTALLRSDGTAVACGRLSELVEGAERPWTGATAPPWPAAASQSSSRGDGTSVACGRLAVLVVDLTRVQVAAGGRRTALLRSDGNAVACSCLAELVKTLAHEQVAAGERPAALLRARRQLGLRGGRRWRAPHALRRGTAPPRPAAASPSSSRI